MNKQLDYLDFITLLSFEISVLSLYIALLNLDENRDQNDELKEILHYVETHLKEQDKHLASQDRILENITKGGI